MKIRKIKTIITILAIITALLSVAINSSSLFAGAGETKITKDTPKEKIVQTMYDTFNNAKVKTSGNIKSGKIGSVKFIKKEEVPNGVVPATCNSFEDLNKAVTTFKEVTAKNEFTAKNSEDKVGINLFKLTPTIAAIGSGTSWTGAIRTAVTYTYLWGTPDGYPYDSIHNYYKSGDTCRIDVYGVPMVRVVLDRHEWSYGATKPGYNRTILKVDIWYTGQAYIWLPWLGDYVYMDRTNNTGSSTWKNP